MSDELFGYVIVIVIFLFLCLPIRAVYTWSTEDEIQVLVNHRESVKSGSEYLIFTESETFKNVDTIFKWKFDSSDVYRDIHPGKTYKVTVYGWRVPFLSMYRNIVKASEVTPPEVEATPESASEAKEPPGR